MSRKDDINSLFLKVNTAALSPAKAPERVRTGAIAAMGASLQEMSESAKAADRLKRQLADGDAVVALSPALIDGSKIADRIPVEIDHSFEQLRSSIAENGQQVPILVRPHPDAPGRFQIAYGRRRLRAAEMLGASVKAIVKALSDHEMIVAQGRENLDRQDLSFIEKALFAKSLEDAGFDRAVLIEALSTDKADLSRYIAVARQIPEALVRRIGPAPKCGRARWLALAEKIKDPAVLALATEALSVPEIAEMDSDTRFQAVWKAISIRPQPTQSQSWLTPHGKRAGQIERSANRTALVFNERIVPDFADFVSSRLDALFAEFSEVSDKITRES